MDQNIEYKYKSFLYPDKNKLLIKKDGNESAKEHHINIKKENAKGLDKWISNYGLWKKNYVTK